MRFFSSWLGLLALVFGVAHANSIYLTPEDSAWIKAHPVVRVGIDRNRNPIEFVDEEGVHRGISSEVLQHIAALTGIRFETVTNLPWKKVQEEIQAKNIDMLVSARPTEERLQYMDFTLPYMQIPTVIVVRKGVKYVESVQDLDGLRLAIVRGNASSEILLKQGLKSEVMEYESYREALMGMANNHADVLLGNLVVLTQEIQGMGAAVRIAAPTDFTTELAIGVRKDWPELTSIMNRALVSLTDDELAGIKRRWVNTQVVIGVPWGDVIKMGLTLFIAFALVLGTVIWGNRKLNREVAERVRAEARAYENEQSYRALFHNLDQAFAMHEVIYDSAGKPIDFRFIEVNAAFCRVFGVDEKAIAGLKRSEMKTALSPEWLARLFEVAETGLTFQGELHIPGISKWMRVSVFCPKHGFFASLMNDITEQKERLVEMTSQRDEMSHFIYTISHDLKGPILTITSFGQMLQEDIAAGNREDVEKDLLFIRKAADRMTLLLNGLLEVGRLGRVELHPKVYSLESLVQGASDLIEGEIREAGLKIRNIQAGVQLEVDHDRMIQLFQNLLENAAKYRNKDEEAWVEVVVETRGYDSVIVVRDNGRGIPIDKLTRVFNLFERFDKNSQGTGVGLALVKRIVDLHKGRVWVESGGPGKGACFCIYLPNLRLQTAV